MVEGPPREVVEGHGQALAEAGIALPLATRLHTAWPDLIDPRPPLSQGLRRVAPTHADRLRAAILPEPIKAEPELVTLDRAACAPPFGPVVLRDVSLALRAGEVLAILGPNGAGKSTLAGCLAGLVPLRAGTRKGPPGAVAFQNPEAHFQPRVGACGDRGAWSRGATGQGASLPTGRWTGSPTSTPSPCRRARSAALPSR